MTALFTLSVCLLSGLLLSRLAKKLGLPAVTAYLIAGLLLGPFCIGSLGLEGLGFTSPSGGTMHRPINSPSPVLPKLWRTPEGMWTQVPNSRGTFSLPIRK